MPMVAMAPFSASVAAAADRLAERLRALDVVIGREHRHDALRVAGRDVERRQAHAGRGVAGAGLDDEVLGRQPAAASARAAAACAGPHTT